jgi:hypothetical protein
MRPSLPFRTPVRARLGVAALLLLATACASRGPSFVPPSRPADFSLAGIPWGISGDSVTSLIERRGYNFNRTDNDGDMWFDGVLYHSPTRLYAFMAEEQLVKFRVHIGSPDADVTTVYENARAELIRQYGRPRETIETYRAPYTKGDGKQLEAARAGKANIATYWVLNDRARESVVAVRLTEELTVVVDYEGPTWQKESVKRRRRAE